MRQTLIGSLQIQALSPDGRGISFIGQSSGIRGKIVFVEGALPGQTVTCGIKRDKGSYLEGVAQSIEEQLPFALQPMCPHQDQCGGCPLQIMPYGEQLLWKNRLAQESLIKIGGFAPESVEAIWREITPSPRLRNFRNKIELAFGTAGDKIILGYRRRGSHEIFPLLNCALVDEEANRIARSCAEGIQNAAIPTNLPLYLILRKGNMPASGQEGWWITTRTLPATSKARALIRDLGKDLLSNHKAVCFIHEESEYGSSHSGPSRRITCLDQDLKQNPHAATMKIGLCDRDFLLDASSFFQINTEASQTLGRLLMDSGLEGSTLLDLYCGVGAPGQLVAAGFKKGFGIEASPASIKFAKINSPNPEFSYHAGKTEKILKKLAPALKTDPGVICLADPPRSGMERSAIDLLESIGPSKIAYISCNPATFARDSRLMAGGYALEQVFPVDFFPHTPHLELFSLWSKK